MPRSALPFYAAANSLVARSVSFSTLKRQAKGIQVLDPRLLTI